MDEDGNRTPSTAEPRRDPAIARRMIQVLIQFAMIGVILFACAGRLDWGWAWAYLGVSAAILLCNLLVMPPQLIAERGRLDKNAKAWDKVITSVSLLPALAFPITAGLDQRFGWTPVMGLGVHLTGIAGYGLGQACFTWAMVSNPFFSTQVRIQTERGHEVVRRGPYRLVRHPGYLALMIFSMSGPLALGSLWALVPAGMTVVLMIIRTALEDRTLRAELEGYQAYAGEVRSRLIPGIW